ncbi:MAG: beta strand repeat-containing protein [Bacilli bacterium]
MIDLIKKNIKFIILMLVVIIFGIVGIAYAIKVANFNPIGLNVTTSPIDVNITYDSSVNDDSITSSGKMVPINDSLVTGVDVTDERVIKAKFKVAGVSSNPDNTIYDVALRDINIDCDLRTEDVKWRLYKNGTLLTSGNLSPTFDVMSDNRLILTDTQQDLTTTTDEYVFLLWISESCTGDISTCSKEQEQNKYLNKSFSASIKLELSTKTKKTLVRNTASADSCSFSTTSVPVFNSLTYNGSEQTLVNSGTGYTLVNNTGTNAGEYVVTAKLNNGYKWTDGTTDDKVIKGKINKKTATVVADSQSISYGGSINSTKYTTLDLLSGHSVSSIFLDTSTVDVGVGTITPTSARIVDADGADVTDNYNLSYVSGTLTIGCSSSSSITVDLPSTLTYGTSGTYTYTVSPTNLLVSCTSSDTSIATCSVDTTNKTVTITPKGTGSVNITLNGEVPNSNDECSLISTSKAVTINCSNTATEPIVTSSQDYTGSIRIGISGGTNVDLGGTLSATDAGTYNGTATPSKGYCWSDNTNSSKSYSWTISKIADPITITSTTAAYDGNPHPATAKSVSGTAVKLTYYSDSSCNTETNTTNANSTGGAPKNAGTYYVIGETSGTNNYNASISSCTEAVTINKISPTITLSATSGSVDYNATNTFTATTKSPISSSVAGTLTATSADTSYVTITGGASSSITATSSGVNTTITYKGVKGTNNSTAITIEFVPDDSTNFNTVTATYNVSKVSQLPGSISLSEKTATYTGSTIVANTATTNSGGTVTYVYYSDECKTKTATSTGASSEGGAPIDAGTYYVKATVASTDNYTSASTDCIKHTINKKSVAVTWGDTTTFTYNNTAQAPTATATSEITGETINVTRSTGTNAGSYTSTASCSSVTGGRAKCDNYNLTNSTKSFTINKATPTINLSATSGDVDYNDTNTFTATTKSPISSSVAGTLTATSGGTSYVTITGGASSSITATSSGVNTTITYKGAGGTTSATTITVKFTPSDTTNFNTVTNTYSVTAVNKIANTLSVTAKTGLSYNGSAQTLVTVSNAQGTVYYSTSTELTDSNCTSSDCSSGSTTISTGTNAGTYTVYYYTPGNDNYQAKSGSVSVTIDKKTLTPTATANSKAYDGSTSATCNVSLSGVVSGDEVSASSTGSFSSSSVGEGKTVTCSSISLSGTDKDNYSLSTTSVTTTATIGYWKNNSNVYYENIANAINGTDSGGTITLLYGYTESNTVTLSKTITMNTNGKTLNYDEMSSVPLTISSGGTLNVTGTGTINSDNLRGIVNSGGTFNCSNASFTGSSIHLYTTSGTSTNTSCTFNKETVTDSDNAYSVVAVSGGTFNMSGGSISGVGYGLNQSGGTANITGGTINGSTALRHSAGTANVTAGTLTGTYYGIYSKSGNLNIGTAPSDGTSINRHTNNKSDKVSPHIESTTSTTSYCGIYIENSVFRMYFGMVKAIGSAIKVSADNTNTVAIDGGSLISTGYVAYYNLSTARTALTGDAIIVANSSSSAINTNGTVLINNDNDQSTTGLNGIQTYFSGCSGNSCYGRYWGTTLLSKSGYGIYGNASAALSIGNNSYSEDSSSASKMYRNQGATICAGSSSFVKLTNLYWFVGWSYNGTSAYKSNVTTMNLSDVRDYLENYSTTATTCSRTIDDTTYSMTYSYYSYPKSKTTPPGTKVTTNATMYSFRAEATSCTGTSSCSQSNCSTLGDLKSGSVIYLIEKVSGSSIYYNAWVKLSDFSSSPGAAYNQLAGVNNACSSTTYTTQVISGTTYVKARVPLKSSSCTNSCCASSCTIS